MKILVDIEIPELPDFFKLRSLGSGGLVDIAQLEEADLRKLGAEWIEALVRHAHERRQGK